MHNQGIKVVQDIIKIVHKIKNISYFIYNPSNLFDQQFQPKSVVLANSTSIPRMRQLYKFPKFEKKSSIKQSLNQKQQQIKQQIIQKLIKELHNSRQRSLKLQQLDPSKSINGQKQHIQNIDKQISQYFHSFKKKQHQQQQLQLIQLNKTIINLTHDNQLFKKNTTQLNLKIKQKQQIILEYVQKINHLQQHTQKLQYYIKRQQNIQDNNQKKISNSTNIQKQSNRLIDSTKTKHNIDYSLTLQTDNSNNDNLKKQIEKLKIDLNRSIQLLNQKNNQIVKLANKFKNIQELEKQKIIHFNALAKEYMEMKQTTEEMTLLGQREKLKQVETNFSQNSQVSQQTSSIISLQAQLKIQKQKYQQLQQKYRIQLNKQILSIPPIQKNISINTISSNNNLSQIQLKSQDSRQKNLQTNKSSIVKISSAEYQQNYHHSHNHSNIKKKQSHINKSMSQETSITCFQQIINPNQLTNKIHGFDYNNSIINKIDSSKFIHSFPSKISFILQYTCILQKYFTRNFLSCLRQQLMMQNKIYIKSINIDDLNPLLFNNIDKKQIQFSKLQQSSVMSMSSQNNHFNKFINSSSKMFINNQFSISQISNTNNTPWKNKKGLEQSQNFSSSQSLLCNQSLRASTKLNEKMLKIQKLQRQLKQISQLLKQQQLNINQIKDNSQLIHHIKNIKNNQIVQIIIQLIRQNQICKKYVNQMIKNQQRFTKQNNQIYFQESTELDKKNGSLIGQDKSFRKSGINLNKNDCNIM